VRVQLHDVVEIAHAATAEGSELHYEKEDFEADVRTLAGMDPQ
jgi:hypothetical protein